LGKARIKAVPSILGLPRVYRRIYNYKVKAIMSKYLELRAVDVSDKIERKNGLSYLSWAWAVDTLLIHDQSATWAYGQPVMFGETVMVFCTVTAFGKSMTAQLPVMDYRNKAIPNPDAFAVNTAMQRCLAKAIALHGLGLSLYVGEDLWDDVDTEDTLTADVAEIKAQKSPTELKVVFAKLYKKYQGKPSLKGITNAYNDMKAQFNETSTGTA
jgi:hypothetical protein